MKKLIPMLLLIGMVFKGCGLGVQPESVETAVNGTSIVFRGDRAEISGTGAVFDGGVLRVGAAGTYTLSGSLENGQILVDTGEEAMKVTLVLDGLSVVNPNGPALHVKQAKNFCLTLGNNSENLLRSGEENWIPAAADQSGAALYAEDDLDISGSGKLTVLGYLNNGIGCKNDVDIHSGEIYVIAVNHGIRAKDSFELKGGHLTIMSLGDGIKTTTGDKEGKGFVEISGGELTVGARGDGIDAATELRVTGGNVAVTAEGEGTEQSSKALKAAAIELSGGVLALYAQEDAIHTDGDMVLSDFLELLGIDEDSFEAESETVGGWTVESFGDFPQAGDSFRYEDWTFTVLSMDGRRVEKLLAKKAPQKEEE